MAYRSAVESLNEGQVEREPLGRNEDLKGADEPESDEEDSAQQISVKAAVRCVAEALRRKDAGNSQFYQGRMLAKHTAGRNALSDSCMEYAMGLQELAKADAMIKRLRWLEAQSPQDQPQGGREDGEGDHPAKGNDRSDAMDAAATQPDGSTVLNAESDAAAEPTLAEVEQTADAVRPALYLNLAATNLLLEEWTPALACCQQVLEVCVPELATAVDAGGAVPLEFVVSSGDGSDSGGGSGDGDSGGCDGGSDGDRRAAGAANSQNDAAGLSSPLLPPLPSLPLDMPSNSDLAAHPLAAVAAKALYRRSQARRGMGDAAAGREDLRRALRIRPADTAIRRELEEAEAAAAREAAQEALKKETEAGRERLKARTVAPAVGSSSAQAGATTGQATIPGSATKAAVVPGASCGTLLPPPQGKHIPAVAPASAPPAKSAAAAASSPPRAAGASTTVARVETTADDASEIAALTRNGGTGGGGESGGVSYQWAQSETEVRVHVPVPSGTTAKDLCIELRRNRVCVAWRNSSKGAAASAAVPAAASSAASTAAAGLATAKATEAAASALRIVATPAETTNPAAAKDGGGGGDVTLFEGALERPIDAAESLWMLERPGCVTLFLQKAGPPPGAPPVLRWWPRVVQGDAAAAVDASACRDDGENGYSGGGGSVAAVGGGSGSAGGAMAGEGLLPKDPEERQRLLREARNKMEAEAAERERTTAAALKSSPAKAELFRRLKESYPDIPITMK